MLGYDISQPELDFFKKTVVRCIDHGLKIEALDLGYDMPFFKFIKKDDDVILYYNRKGKEIDFTLEEILKEVKVEEKRLMVTLHPNDNFKYRDEKGKNKEPTIPFYILLKRESNYIMVDPREIEGILKGVENGK